MRLLFSLLLFSINISGQDILFPKDSSFVKLIEDLPSQEPFDTSRTYHKVEQAYVYITGTKDLYDIFGYEISTKQWEFNFADYHILGQRVCKQCLLYCNHDGERAPCHRNACNYEWVWQMRENKKTFKEIPSTTNQGYVGAKLTDNRLDFFS